MKRSKEEHQGQRCLVMFVKYPEKGKVKTRLSEYFDEDTVVRLYRAFISDLLERLPGDDYDFRIAYHPREKKEAFSREFGKSFVYMPQTGTDLGKRMLNAFRRCFSDGYRSVVVIGSDSPDLPRRIVMEAFQALEKGAVIGPACDGGYYLIGFRREQFLPGVFTGITWGGDSVCKTTLRILEDAGIGFHVLPVWRDIDRPEDISALIEDSDTHGFASSKTIACLREAKMK